MTGEMMSNPRFRVQAHACPDCHSRHCAAAEPKINPTWRFTETCLKSLFSACSLPSSDTAIQPHGSAPSSPGKSVQQHGRLSPNIMRDKRTGRRRRRGGRKGATSPSSQKIKIKNKTPITIVMKLSEVYADHDSASPVKVQTRGKDA